MISIFRCFIFTCAFFSASWFHSIPVNASEPPVAILVDGFGDCCTNRMHQLIDGLRSLGVEFPAIQARGLSGDDYTDFTVPWNSFSGMNQGFSVDLDPQTYVQQAIKEAASSPGSGSLLDGFSSLANIQDSLANPNIIEKVMQKVRKGSDSQFVEEVSAFINALPKDRKVILIGHSFGADSIMEVAPKLQHSVLFLGAIDAVGSAGQRSLNRKRKVSSNVKYFLNRWQNDKVLPFDYKKSGSFEKCSASLKCDQRESSSNVGHVDLPATDALQVEILEIIKRLLGEKPSTNSVASQPTKKEVKPADLLGSTSLKNLFGN
ncbi:MAG: hypothetical protein ACI8PD_001427 [Nitrospinales bacterium]|jgi:hypothetical protein